MDEEKHPEQKAGPPEGEASPKAGREQAERPRHGKKHRAEPAVAGEELHRLESQLDEMKDKYLRAIAELDNFRKRAARERERSAQMAVAAVARGLLPVIDNFERALSAARNAKDVQAVIGGVKMVEQQIYRILQDNRIEEIEALDRPFDPHCHEVVLQRPAGGRAAGTVVEVLERGFRLGDVLIRAAKVAVAAPPPDAQREDTGEARESTTPPPGRADDEKAGQVDSADIY